MSTKIIKKYFKEETDKLYIDLPIPILHRQIATNIIYDEELNIFIDNSEEINNIFRIKAYLSECSKEYLKKYNNYNNCKKIFYSTNIFKRIIKNRLPIEIILEIIKYL
jgi:hypothetical protein